ncbi:MAG: hypothetical protein IJZ68_06755 [Bacteroidaceae bacterium]|nr:hypothetical protein [Bacteroidaceae bacterium]
MSAVTTNPKLIDIVIGDDKCKLVYDDGDSFYVSRETYDRALGTLINGSAIDGKEAIRRDFAIEA